MVGSIIVFTAAFLSWKLLPRTAPAPFVHPLREDDDEQVAEQPTLVD